MHKTMSGRHKNGVELSVETCLLGWNCLSHDIVLDGSVSDVALRVIRCMGGPTRRHDAPLSARGCYWV